MSTKGNGGIPASGGNVPDGGFSGRIYTSNGSGGVQLLEPITHNLFIDANYTAGSEPQLVGGLYGDGTYQRACFYFDVCIENIGGVVPLEADLEFFIVDGADASIPTKAFAFTCMAGSVGGISEDTISLVADPDSRIWVRAVVSAAGGVKLGRMAWTKTAGDGTIDMHASCLAYAEGSVS